MQKALSSQPNELVQAAQSMVARLLERATEADNLRRLPQSTIDELIANRFFSIVAPKRCGGLELNLDHLLAVAKTLAKGCGSTAWVTSLLGTHNWLAGLYPQQTQDELFAGNSYLLAPAIFAPSGRATAVDGGFRLSGDWSFGSGISHSDWIFLSALRADDEDNIVGMECLALPVKDVLVADSWHTVGMRGTGSHNVRVENAFVPAHRALPFIELLEGTTKAARESANPIYRIPLVPYLCFTAAAPALGIGIGALEQFTAYLGQRILMGGEQQKEKTAAQIRLGESRVALQAAESLMDSGVKDLIDKAAKGHQFTIEERVNYRAQACYIASMVKQVVDKLVEAAGAKAQFETHPLQRFQRDINTLRGHVVFDMDSTMEMQGKAILGLPPNQALV